MTVLDCTVMLGGHHNLSLPELHSVQMAYQVLPHTCMFFGVASRMLLEVEPNQIPSSYRKGYGFGFLLASMMVELFMRTRESGIRQDFRRFSCYREPLVPTRDRWEEMAHETTVYCLHVFAAYGQPSSKKVRTDQYKKIVATISDIWDGTGTLGANHSINQKACLGFLPAWCREVATVETSSRVVKFFNEKYKLRRKLNRTELDRFLSTVSRRLEVVFKTQFTERIVENVLCKTFRALSKQDAKKGPSWCDTLLPGQLLYKFESNYISVISPSGETERMEEKAIVTRLPYGDRLLTMDELVSELDLPSTMPSESRRHRYLFYEKVWSPKAQFQVDFKVPQAVPLSKKAGEITKTILSKWLGSCPIPRKRKRTAA